MSKEQYNSKVLDLIFNDNGDNTGDENGTVTTHRQIETVLDNDKIYSCATTTSADTDTDNATDTDTNWMHKYVNDSCQENIFSNDDSDSDSSSCSSSSHNILSTSNLQNPKLFYYPSLNDQDMLRDYYYVIYCGNSDCRSNIKLTLTTHDYNSNNDSGVVTGSVVGTKGYMSDVNYSVPRVNDDISWYSSYHPVQLLLLLLTLPSIIIVI